MFGHHCYDATAVLEDSEKFALGGMGFAISCADRVIDNAAHALFSGYGVDHAEWTLRFVGRDPHDFAPVDGLVCARVGAESWRVQLGSELEVALRPDGATAWVAKSDDFFGPGALQNVVRLCLTLRGTLLIHATGIVHEGRAFLFAGKSGAGKSTLAKLFARELMLGDEMMCIDTSETVHRAPFTGERLPPAVPLSAPLGGIVCFGQGAFSLVRADVRALLPHVVNPSRDQRLTREILDRVMALRVPIYRASLPVPTAALVAEWVERLAGF